MARIMLAWELGGGWGHAVPLSQLAAQLLARGHDVHLVWKDLAPFSELLREGSGAARLHLWQAPLWLRHPVGLPEPASYAELMLRAGFGDAAPLGSCVRAWRQLIDAIRPDLLVADSAPTALLAARGLALRVAMFGNGFSMPPPGRPLPPFRDWEPVEPARIEASEARVLASCNAVLGAQGGPTLGALQQLFEVDEQLLLGWPALDHLHDSRRGGPAPFRGWPAPPRLGAPPQWPQGDATASRIFGYLSREHPSVEALLGVLRDGRWPALVHLAGAGADEARQRSGGSLAVVGHLVDLGTALGQAALLIGHAGSGTVHASLQAGVPVLMLPMVVEQLLLARRVASAGAGVMLGPGDTAKLPAAIGAVAGSPGFAGAARALAAQQPAADEVMPQIAARCESLSALAR